MNEVMVSLWKSKEHYLKNCTVFCHFSGAHVAQFTDSDLSFNRLHCNSQVEQGTNKFSDTDTNPGYRGYYDTGK